MCNINFKEELTEKKIEEMLQIPNPEINAIRLFKNLGLEYGFDELYKADENKSHEQHRVVSQVFRALPVISPEVLEDDPEKLVKLRVWSSLGKGFHQMINSPRYFVGRHVLVNTTVYQVQNVINQYFINELNLI